MGLRAPFPWFGGKSRVADIVWDRFGDVANYVEPFFGSGAVLLARPHEAGIETVNDKDCFVANFWRALQADPDAVAEWADWPVNEADLHARHWWLVNRVELISRMKTDPDYHDAKIAGWWVWGLCQWIGSGWCANAPQWDEGNAGMGIHRPSQQLPHLGDAGKGELRQYMHLLAERLRRVRVCCGDWTRVTGPAVTFRLGLTGVFLDPPYSHEARDDNLYAVDSMTVAQEVWRWAMDNGDNPLLRIALCGYEGEFDMPDTWECVAWKAAGGYASQNGNGNDNGTRERIWFSPHCLHPARGQLQIEMDLPTQGEYNDGTH